MFQSLQAAEFGSFGHVALESRIEKVIGTIDAGWLELRYY